MLGADTIPTEEMAMARPDRRDTPHHRTGAAVAAHTVVLSLLLLVCLPVLGTAQAPDAPEGDEAPEGPDRGGFTLLTTIGFAIQKDAKLKGAGLDGTNIGVAGLNLGIGGFVTDQVALLLRFSGMTADIGPTLQTSGFFGPSLQYWPSDRWSIEAGIGGGFSDIDNVSNDGGLGLLVAVGRTVFNSGSHNLHVGLEYVPVFTDPKMVHGFGLVFGWQLL
ncbi:MAG: hypothetical protein RQ745_10640 [Longimicrobiales bacterium]|nr:hypothetical protein [Longimicrobiales bacterium]